MQAYRSTSLAFSSGSKLWLQATFTEPSTSSKVIQSGRPLHSNVGQHLSPSSNLLPSRGLQQQAKPLVFANLTLSSNQPEPPPARGLTLNQGSTLSRGLSPASCQPPYSSRPYSSSVAPVSSYSNNDKVKSDVQRFLRQKGVDYSETHSCLKVSLPVSILGGSQSTTWADIDKAFVPVFINKVTGNIVCPLLGLVGPWTQLQEVIETWLKNRTRAKGEVEAGYPKLQKN